MSSRDMWPLLAQMVGRQTLHAVLAVSASICMIPLEHCSFLSRTQVREGRMAQVCFCCFELSSLGACRSKQHSFKLLSHFVARVQLDLCLLFSLSVSEYQFDLSATGFL